MNFIRPIQYDGTIVHPFFFPEDLRKEKEVGLEKSIEQSDLESCECEAADDSDLIRHIEAVNTPYPVAQKTTKPNKVERNNFIRLALSKSMRINLS
ncbi:hypothetical protein Tco_0949773 [Tanacetum coccineum]